VAQFRRQIHGIISEVHRQHGLVRPRNFDLVFYSHILDHIGGLHLPVMFPGKLMISWGMVEGKAVYLVGLCVVIGNYSATGNIKVGRVENGSDLGIGLALVLPSVNLLQNCSFLNEFCTGVNIHEYSIC